MTGVIGLIFFMYWLMRKVNKQMRTASGSRLKILDRALTGRDSSLLVVSVSGRLMLVGVSAGRIEKLCDLDITEEEYFISDGSEDKQGIKFSDVLFNLMNPKAQKRSINQMTETQTEVEGEEEIIEPDS